MTQNHNRFIGLCLPYAFGKLNPRNRNFFEHHLKSGCEQCHKELAEIYEAMSLLPLALPQQSAPSSLRNKVLSAVRSGKVSSEPRQERDTRRNERRDDRKTERRDDRRNELRPPQPAPVTMRQSAPASERPLFGYAVGFLFIVIIIALGWYTNSLITRLDLQEQEILALTNQTQTNNEVLKILQAPHIDVMRMNGTNASPTAYGKIVWDMEKNTALLQTANLAPAPAEKDYQLWIIKNNVSTSAGVFVVEGYGAEANYFKILSLNVSKRSEFDSFAITLEPKGGSPQPTGQVHLMSESSPK